MSVPAVMSAANGFMLDTARNEATAQARTLFGLLVLVNDITEKNVGGSGGMVEPGVVGVEKIRNYLP